MSALTRFLFLTDLHYGYERRAGHKVALHYPAAWACALAFARDFKPHVVILGGDVLDCSPVSHHTKGQPGKTEGLRLLSDARECYRDVIRPVEALGAKTQVFITGNHERFLTDLTDVQPELEGIVDLRTLLRLGDKWTVIEQGGWYRLGHLRFLHGDTLGGGDAHAKKAVTDLEANVRYGHFHTASLHTKCSPLDGKLAKSGMSVGCLCRKTPDPAYLRGRVTRWVQSILAGYVAVDGTFQDYPITILNGRMIAPNGKVYTA